MYLLVEMMAECWKNKNSLSLRTYLTDSFPKHGTNWRFQAGTGYGVMGVSE